MYKYKIDNQEYKTISNNKIIQEDLEYSANSNSFDINQLKNKTILITGTTGFIGKQLVKTLLCINNMHNLNIKIVAMARNKEKAESIFNNLLEYNNLTLLIQDINKKIILNDKIDFIIHCANPVNSKFFIEKPVETIETIVLGTKNILDLALEHKVESIVYLSTMEVYGIIDIPIIKENNYGLIDPLNIRSSYSEGKKLAECMCKSYFEEYNVPTKIIRLSQIFGAGIDYNDSRVLSQFVRSVIEEKDIILHTKGNSVLSNCYISDAVNGILTVLLKGQKGECYNLANSNNIFSIKQIAERLINLNKKSKLIINIENTNQYRPDTVLNLDTTKINSLGWKAQIGIDEMILRTIESFINKGDINE